LKKNHPPIQVWAKSRAISTWQESMMGVPFVQKSEGVSSRFTPEIPPGAILGLFARVNGLSKEEAHLLADFLNTRGQNFIAVVDQPEDSVVLWKK
jgi:hypothetical protein